MIRTLYDRKREKTDDDKKVLTCFIYLSGKKRDTSNVIDEITYLLEDYNYNRKLNQHQPQKIITYEQEFVYPDGINPLFISCAIYPKSSDLDILSHIAFAHRDDLETKIKDGNIEILDIIFDTEEEAMRAFQSKDSIIYTAIDNFINEILKSPNFVKNQIIYATCSYADSLLIEDSIREKLVKNTDFQNNNIVLLNLDTLPENIIPLYKDFINLYHHGVILMIYETCKSTTIQDFLTFSIPKNEEE